MLTGKLVGPSGEVVRVERDSRSIARARGRVAEAGLRNVSFTQSDVSQIQSSKLFDAAVGRYILMFVPDPVSIVSSLVRLVRPGGVIAFQEPSWAAFLLLAKPFPLWFAGISLADEVFRRSGANMEMGLTLYRTFKEAGLPPPSMHMETLVGTDSFFAIWLRDVLCSLRPQIQQSGLSLEKVGDLDTLPERIQAEVAASNTVISWMALVGAWSRRPIDQVSL